MAHIVELSIPPRSDHLSLVRLLVQAAASIDGRLPERRIDDLRLAASEACANALDAEAAAGSTASVVTTIEIGQSFVSVTVVDHAGGFDVAQVAPIPAVTDPSRLRHERGLGIPLMRSLVDEVTFTPTVDGTAVRLEIRL